MFNVIDDLPAVLLADNLVNAVSTASKPNVIQSEAYFTELLPKNQPVNEVYFQLED